MAGFNNIIGHEEIIRHLKNAMKTGKVSHSYIFTGRPGSGKKLLATTYAMTLQCEQGGTEPCQKCDSCKKAMGKNHPDIIMVNHEKPGTISIDEIREQVIYDVAVKPYCSPYKIYIIPDAELMTVQAQNALLKTIEEPPEYAVIMLLTSNADAMLPTIQSRCVRLDLKVVDDSLVKKISDGTSSCAGLSGGDRCKLCTGKYRKSKGSSYLGGIFQYYTKCSGNPEKCKFYGGL